MMGPEWRTRGPTKEGKKGPSKQHSRPGRESTGAWTLLQERRGGRDGTDGRVCEQPSEITRKKKRATGDADKRKQEHSLESLSTMRKRAQRP